MTAEKKKLYITQQVLLLYYMYVPRKLTSVGESFDIASHNVQRDKIKYLETLAPRNGYTPC